MLVDVDIWHTLRQQLRCRQRWYIMLLCQFLEFLEKGGALRTPQTAHILTVDIKMDHISTGLSQRFGGGAGGLDTFQSSCFECAEVGRAGHLWLVMVGLLLEELVWSIQS